jgi:hypothetical protein
VGVRPRGNRIEVTADFTPDPGLMIATATLVLGVVREVMSWPSYDLSVLDRQGIPVVADVVPGKHTTRKGWLTKDFNFPQSPFTADIDARTWRARDGRTRSLRQMARETAWMFRRSIRRFSDPFSFRLLFAILRGRSPSLLELPDRPRAYEDVGRLCRWGMVIAALRSHDDRRKSSSAARTVWNVAPFDAYVASRDRERATNGFAASAAGGKGAVSAPSFAGPAAIPPSPAAAAAGEAVPAAIRRSRAKGAAAPGRAPAPPEPPVRTAVAAAARKATRADDPATAKRPRTETAPRRRMAQRRGTERRSRKDPIPFPDRRLSRSAYEQVFLKLVSGGRLRIGRELYTPVGMKGWYHAILRRDSDGKERMLSVDQLLKKLKDWQ